MVIICLKSADCSNRKENWKNRTPERGECSRSKWTSAVTFTLEAFANSVNGHKDENPFCTRERMLLEDRERKIY